LISLEYPPSSGCAGFYNPSGEDIGFDYVLIELRRFGDWNQGALYLYE